MFINIFDIIYNSPFSAYSFKPWKTVVFSVLQTENNSFSYNLNSFNDIKQKNPELYKNDTCIIVKSRAKNETLYEGSSPFCFNIRFWAYTEKDIEISKIQIFNEDLEYYDTNVDYFEKINLKKENEFENNGDNYGIIVYSTEYIFDLDSYENNIKMRIVFRIDNENYDCLFTLKRIERKGLLRARI